MTTALTTSKQVSRLMFADEEQIKEMILSRMDEESTPEGKLDMLAQLHSLGTSVCSIALGLMHKVYADHLAKRDREWEFFFSDYSAMKEKDKKTTYTAKEAQGVLHISKNTMNKLLREGKLYATRPDGIHYQITRDALGEYLGHNNF